MAAEHGDDVCVLLPAYNEGETVADVITGFHNQGLDNVLVVDGDSEDETVAVAREAGARVVEQRGEGKGQAVREAVTEHVDSRYILMADADATYEPTDAPALLEPLQEGEAEHTIGNRFADMQSGAMTRLNRLGNRLINRAFRLVHGSDFQDILSGYRAFTADSFRRLTLTADGFGIETEMAVECAKNEIPVTVVPITYLPRPSGSNTNLKPVRDGGIIFLELYRKAKTSNPLFYFGSVGTLALIVGTSLAGFVIYRFLFDGVSHEVLALGSAGGILLGVQLLIFGFLADMILSLHRDQIERIERVERQNRD